jgi:signal transduction histidine kinase/pSer/pThr/pTyr-binding forkhead associated (FHA) protein
MKIILLREIASAHSDEKTYSFLREKEIFVGRDKKCEVCIPDAKSSRCHVRLFVEGPSWFVEDLASTNGTLLNGKVISKNALGEGDEITIGDTSMKIVDLVLPDNLISSSSVRIRNDSSTVIVSSVPHMEADLLQTRSAEVLDDLLLENTNLRKVCEISQLFAGQLEIQSALDASLNTMIEILKADTACILLYSNEKQDWVMKALVSKFPETAPIEVSRTIIGQAISKGMSILTADPMTDERFDPSLSIISQGISSALCSPLKIKNQFSGVLFFDRRKKAKLFTEMDLRFTATLSNILGLFLEKELLLLEMRTKDRLAVIGEVMAGLAHHTKNILTGLKFSVSALETVAHKKKWELVPKYLQHILGQELRISNLVLNMLSYSKERVPLSTPIPLKEIIEETIAPYMDHLKENDIQWILDCVPNFPPVFAEEAAMHHIFLNLFVNAMDSFRHKPIGKTRILKVSMHLSADQKNVILEFYDTACGIPASKLGKIFTVFYSSKGAEGTGLGLAVVQKTIQEHKGTITVDSQENEWTQFTISLPVGTEL